MRSLFSLFVFFDLGPLFHFSCVPAKNAGHVHVFKTLLFSFMNRLLCFFGSGLFGSFNFFHFLYYWRWLAPMENCGRFHAGFSLFLLLEPARNRPGGFGILQEPVLLRFRNRCFMTSGLCRSSRRPFLAVLRQ